MKKIGRFLGRALLLFAVTVLAAAVTLVLSLNMICNGPSEAARELFVTTVLESGQLKFVASLFLSEEEISEIVSRTSMAQMDTDIDTSLISVDHTDREQKEETQGEQAANYDENGVEIIEISSRSFYEIGRAHV